MIFFKDFFRLFTNLVTAEIMRTAILLVLHFLFVYGCRSISAKPVEMIRRGKEHFQPLEGIIEQ